MGPRACLEALKRMISCACRTSKDGSSVAKSPFQLLYQLRYLSSLLFTKTGNCRERKHVHCSGADVMAQMTRTDMNATKYSSFFLCLLRRRGKCKADLDSKIRVSAGNEGLNFQLMSKRFTKLTFSNAMHFFFQVQP